MATTEEMLEAIKEGLNTTSASSSGHIEISSDAYEDLRNATPEELLAAVIWFYRQESTISTAEAEEIVSLLRIGWELALPGGWERVAPVWLRESKEQDEAG